MAATSAIFKGAYTKLLTSLGLGLETGQKIKYTDGAAAGRIPVSDATGVLSLNTISGGSADTGLTQGSVVFVGPSGVMAQDNATLFWNNTNKWLGVGTNSPASRIHVDGTANEIKVIAQGGVGQTANVQEWRNSSGTVMTSVDATGTISSPGAGARSERFGSGSVSAGQDSVAIGWGASSAGPYSVALGRSASTTGNYSIAIGYGATISSTASNNILFSNGSITGTKSNNVVIGINASVTGNDGFALGFSAMAGPSALAIGEFAVASGSFSCGLGGATNATHTGALCFGRRVASAGTYEISMGFGEQYSGNPIAFRDVSGTTTATGQTSVEQARRTSSWIVPEHNTRTAQVLWSLQSNGSTLEYMRVTGDQASGTAAFGFFGAGSTAAAVTVSPNTASNAGLIVKGKTSQTANLQEWRDSSNNVLGSVCAAGCGKFSGMSLGVRTINTNTTLVANDYTALVTAASGNVTITLPAVAGEVGRIYVIKKTDSSANSVIIDGNGSETIDGELTQTITTQYAFIKVQSNGTNWHIIG